MPSRTIRTAVVALLACSMLATLTFVGPADQAAAQLYDPPAERFGANARGDIDFIGNTLLTCPPGGDCAVTQTSGNNQANNNYSMIYVDQDADGSTFNSSASTLSLPAGANVLFAGLYWGARSSDGARNQALLQAPGGSYQTVTANVVDSDGGSNYQAFYDATAEVQAAGNGQYFLGNVQADTGGGRHAGWSMIVVYEDTTQPFRNLTVFDGFARVNSNNPVEIIVDGFTTPVVGPVSAKVTQVVYEGDERFSGDQMLFEGTVLSDGAHPAGNFFNSRISKDGALFNDKSPNYVDQLGFDIARTDVTGLLANSQSAATVNYTSAGDWYYVGVVATAIDIFVPDLETDLEKTAVDINGGDVVPGDVITYTISSSNLGLDPAQNAFLTDVVPAGTTYVDNSLALDSHPTLPTGPQTDAVDGDVGEIVAGEVRFDLGTLGVSESYALSFDVTVDAGTEFSTITNEAFVDYDSATTGDPFIGSGSVDIDIEAAAELVLVSKTDDVDPVTAGDQVVYAVEVRNDGPSPAMNPVVTDTLPTGLSFVSGPGCSAAGQVVTCSLASPLASGGTDSVAITVLVDADAAATTVTNTASVASDTVDPDDTNNDGSETTEIVRSTDVSIVKAGPSDVLNAGEPITYMLTVQNTGPSTGQSTIVSDVLPAGVTLVSATPDNGSTCAGAALLTCDLGTLAAGETVIITIDVLSDPTLADGAELNNASSVTTDTPETNLNNNQSAVNNPVARVAELTIDKTGPATINAGEIVSFTVEVSNNGPSVATGPVITDNLPLPLVFDAATSSPGCTLSAPPQGVTCQLTDMLPGAGESQTVTISALVPSDTTPQSINNTASVTATEDAVGASDDHLVEITREVALTIAKTDNVEPIAAGALLTYTIIAGNDGPSDASAVSIVDSLPPEVAFTSAAFVPAGDGTCTHDAAALGGDVTCTPTAAVLASGQSVTIQVEVATPSDLDPGVTLSNTATVTATEDPVGATAVETTNSINEVNLSIGKIVTPSPVRAGEDVTYTVTFLNEGPSDADNAQIVDTLPAEVSHVSSTSPDGVCSHDGSLAGGDVTCTFGTIAPNQTVTVTIVATVDASTPDDSLATNTVSGTADAATEVTGDAVVNVQREADLAIVKTVAPDPVVAGQNLTYTLTVDNLGPSDATTAAVLDPLPAGLTVVSLPAGCTDAAGTITCDLGIIEAGVTEILAIEVTVDASVQPGIDLLPNTATVSADEPDPDPDNNESTVPVDVTADVGLSLTKVDNVDPVTAGELVIYTLEAGNAGPSDADGVTITDTPPAGLIFDPLNSSANCVDNAGTIECNLGLIAPGGTDSVNLAFTVDAAAPDGTVTNSATVTSDEDAVGVVATEDTTIERRADTAVVKTASPEPVVPGTPITYTFVVSNNGPSTATNTQLVDVLPSSLAFVSVDDANCSHDGALAGGTLTCTLGDLAPDAEVTIVVVADVDDATTASIANTASVSSDTADPNTDNDSSTTDTPVTPQADVSITKTDLADPVIAGQSIGWTLQVDNAGPSASANTIVTDTLPAQVSFSSASGASCTHDGAAFGGLLTCDLATLGAGEGVTITINGTVDAETTSVFTVNEASVATDTTDTDPTNNDANESTAIEADANLSLSKSATPNPVVAGEQVTYTITISNSGPSAAQAVNVNDALPTGVRYNSTTVINGPATCNHDGAADGGTLACGYGTMSPGETRTVEVLVDVLPNATGTVTNNAVASSPTDPTPPSASAPVTVNTSADLVMTEKTHDVNPAIAGQGLVWTIAIRNDGPSDAVNAEITDLLPSGVTYDDAGSTAACSEAAGTVTCPVGTLAPGETASVEIAVVVDPGELGPIDNTAATSSSTTDPDPGNNSESESTTIEQQSQVGLVKTSSPDPVVAGEQITYTIVAENGGPSIAANAVLTDPLPTGTEFVSAPGCTEAGGLVTCALGDLAVDVPVTVTITVDTDPALFDGSAIVNVASIDWDGNGDPVNAPTSTDVIREADLAITKVDRENEVAAGTDIVWDLTVTNNGSSDATNIVVTDTLPPDTTFNAAASSAECSAAGLVVTCLLPAVTVDTPGALVIAATVDSLVAAGTVLTNEASVSADETDPISGNNTDTEDTVITQVNDLAIAKSATPEPAVAGEQVTWTITVSNNGPSNATNITIQDQLPAGVTFAGGEFTCNDLPNGAPAALVTCTIPGVAAGDSVDLTIVGDIDANLVSGDIFENSVAITGYDGTDPNLDNNDAIAPSTIDRNAGLMLTKSASPSSVVAGEDITWTLTLTNDGPSSASGVTLTDALPAGVTFVSLDVVSGVADCAEAAATISCDVGTAPARALLVGDTVVVEVVATTDADLADGASIDNTANAASPDDADGAEGASSTPVTRSADVSVTKTAVPDPVVAGETVDYLITVENAGPSEATNVVVNDTLPVGVTWASGDCTPNGQTVECSAGTIAADGSAVFSFTANVAFDLADGAQVTNNAVVTATETDPNPDNDDDSATSNIDREADLSIVKDDGDATVTAGEIVSYTMTVVNAGPSQASGIEVTDAVPANTTFDVDASTPGCSVAAGIVTCPVAGPLDPGDDGSVIIAFVGDDDLASGSTITNAASVAGNETDPVSGNDTDGDTTPVVTSADVSIIKDSVETTAVAGSTLTWTLAITNAGPSQAADVQVTDSLPAGLTVLNVDRAECDNSVSCTFPTLDVGETIDIAIETAVDSNQTDALFNDASVTSSTPDPDPTDNTSPEVEVPVGLVADLVIEKSSAPDPVVPGAPIIYTIVVTNNGPSDVVGASMTDTTPPEVVEPTASCEVDAADGLCVETTIFPETSFAIDLVAGASATITIEGTVDPAAVAGFVNTANVTAPVGVTDPNLANNTDDDGDPGTPSVVTDLRVVKTSTPNPATAGEAISYEIVVTNDGPSRAVGASITDPLPAAVLSPSLTCTVAPDDGTCSAALNGSLIEGVFSLDPGASLTIAVDGTVDASATGTLSNTATVVPGPNASDPTPGNNSSTDTNPLETEADLSVTKSADAARVTAGETIAWTVVVENAGPSTAVDVEVTDTLPAGLTLVSEPANCTNGVCDIAAIEPGETVELAFDTLVAADVTGSITNAVEVTSATTDPVPANNTDETPAVPVDVITDLSIVKTSAPDPLISGEAITYTLVVANDGPSDSVGAVVSDPVPAAVLGATATCALVPAGTSCTIDSSDPAQATLDIPVGSSVRVQVTGTIDPAFEGALTNTASVAPGPGATDPDDGDDTSTNVNPSLGEADLSITKTSTPNPVVAGEGITYEIVVTNGGPSSISGAAVRDVLPAEISGATATCAAVAPNTCSAAAVAGVVDASVSLAPGASATITIDGTVAVDATGTLTNTATVEPPAGVTDPNPANDEATDEATLTAIADIYVTKSANAAVAVAGENVSWTITVGNNGPSTATDIVVTDSLPAGLALVAEPANCTDGVCSVASLTPGQEVEIVLETAIDSDITDPITNQVVVEAATPDPEPGNDADSTDPLPIDVVTDLALVKTSAPDPLVAGEEIVYTIVVTNNGPSDSIGATVNDDVPEDVLGAIARCADVAAAAACTVDSQDPAAFTLDIPAGVSVSVEIAGTIDPASDGSLENTATVTSGPNDTDPTPGNNTDTNINPSIGEADLSIVKTSTPAPVVAGEGITYEIVVTNSGPSAVSGATVTDVLPTEIGGVSVSCAAVAPDTCSATADAGVVDAMLSLAPGASATITVEGTVDPSLTGTLTNTATVEPPAGVTDPNPDNDESTDETTVTAIADVYVTKSADAATVTAGEILSWTITVGNNGPSTALDVVVSDALPTGVTLVSEPANCTDGVCSIASLAPGQELEIVLETAVAPSITDPITNQVTVISATPDPDSGNDVDATDPVPVDVVTDLALIKTSAPDPLVAGEEIIYTLVVTNNGPSDSVGASVIDAVPADVLGAVARCVDVVASTACTVVASDPAEFTLDIPSGASVTVEIAGTIDPASDGSLENTATVTAGPNDTDPTLANNSDTNVNPSVGEADLSITKTVIGDVVAGETVTYEIVVTNDGPSLADGATVTDVLPDALSDASASCAVAAPNTCSTDVVAQTVTATVALAPGASATITVEALLDDAATGTLANTATVEPPTGVTDPDLTDDSATDETPITLSADLSVRKNALADSVVAGETLSWRVTVANAGPSTATGIEVTDTLPAGVTLIAEPANCTDGVCSIASLAPGQEIDLVFETLVDSSTTGSLVNEASVTADTPDPDPTNDSTATEPVPVTLVTDLALAKSSTPDPLISGEAIVYTIAVTNNGPSDAVGANVTDPVPAAVLDAIASCADVAAAAACSVDGSDPAAFTLDIPAGSTVSVQVAGTIDPAFDGALENTATVIAGPGATDPAPGNNSDTNVNPSLGETDLTVTKSSSPDVLVPGEAVTYTVTVTNDGPSQANGVRVLDLVPAAVLAPSASCATDAPNTCTTEVNGAEVTASADLAPGASATITISGTIDPTVAGDITNTATVTPPTGFTDPDLTGNTATDVAPTAPSADLVVEKRPAVTEVLGGDTMTWTVVVRNDGPSDAVDVELTDALPAGLSLSDESELCSGGVCQLGTIAAGTSVALEFETVVDGNAPSPLVNRATVTSLTDDPDPTNNEGTSVEVPVIRSTDLSVTKTSAPNPATAGQPIVYTITVTNDGPSDAVGATIIDTVPEAITDVSVACGELPAAGACAVEIVDGQVLGTVDLASGTSVTIVLDATVRSSATDGVANTVQVEPGPNAVDPAPGDNTAIDTNATLGEVDLAIDVTVSDEVPEVGDTISWELVITNNGPSDVSNAQVFDQLPEGVSDVSWVCGEVVGLAGCGEGDGEGGLDLSLDLTAGSSITIVVNAVVTSPDAELTYVVSVTPPAGIIDIAPADNQDEVTVVTPPPLTPARPRVVPLEFPNITNAPDIDGPPNPQVTDEEAPPTSLALTGGQANFAIAISSLFFLAGGALVINDRRRRRDEGWVG